MRQHQWLSAMLAAGLLCLDLVLHFPIALGVVREVGVDCGLITPPQNLSWRPVFQ
jgi:hypothetical protein